MYNHYRHPMMAFWAFALLAISMLWGASAYAVTPAGTVIKNLATVTYEDSLGNSYTAQSNESAVTVAEVYGAVLSKGVTKNGAPAQTVYFPHQLTNNGNTKDSFTLVASNNTDNSKELTGIVIYQDINGNGQPDAGELPITEITIAAGSTAQLVVSAKIPANAVEVDALKVDLTADSTTSEHNFNETVTDIIKLVTTEPVLVAQKEVIRHTLPTTLGSTGEVEYRITIKNNGATLVHGGIYDFLPAILTLKEDEDPSNQDERLSNFISNKDRTEFPDKDKILEDSSETALYMDLNELKSGGTVSFTFIATYESTNSAGFVFDAGTMLKNKAFVAFNPSGDKPESGWTELAETNIVETKLPQYFGVEAHDSSYGEGHNHQTPDTETDASAPVGGVAEFTVIVENTGNGPDSYNLSVNSDAAENTFPEGTVFSFWNETGSLPLTDANTGTLLKGKPITIMVRAQLPAGESKSEKSLALFTATSVGNSNEKASVKLELTVIEAAGVDLAYTTDNTEPDEDKYGSAIPDTQNTNLAPGSTVRYTMYVHNESGIAKSFNLSAHGDVGNGQDRNSYVGTPLDNGLQVTFKDGEDGPVITKTPLVPDGKSYPVTVEVTAPANQTSDNYTFAVIASNGTINDAIQYGVKVTEAGTINLTPNGANQIEAGGVAFYTHRLENLSNKERTIEVRVSEQSGASSGWSFIFEPVTTDTIKKSASSLTVNADLITAVLPAGESIDFRVKVLAPANALPGYMDTLTLQALETTSVGDGVNPLSAFATDTTVVIKGQVRLYKKVHIITGTELGGSDSSARTDEPNYDAQAVTHAKQTASSEFTETPVDKVIPGEDYVVWQVIATNEGDAPANTVIIRDAAPAFTELVTDSAYFVDKDGSGAEDPTLGEVDDKSPPNVTFTVCGQPTCGDDLSKVGLMPGASVEVRFMVKVQ